MCGSGYLRKRLRVKSAWQKECSEAKEVRITSVLFAGDTFVAARKGEMNECVGVTKDVMGEWEERNNENKEESVELKGRSVRTCASWLVGWVTWRRIRIRRGG